MPGAEKLPSPAPTRTGRRRRITGITRSGSQPSAKEADEYPIGVVRTGAPVKGGDGADAAAS